LTVVLKLGSNGCLTVLAIVTARALGPSNRGVLVLLLTVVLFSLLLGSLGVNVGARTQLVAPVDPVPSGHYAGLVLTLLGLQTLLCLAAASTLLPLANVTLPAGQRVLFALLGTVTLGVYLLNDAMNAYGWVAQSSAVDACGSAAQLVIVVGVIAAGAPRLAPIMVGLILGSILQMLIAVAVLRRRGIDLRPRCSRRSWRRLVRSGLPGMGAGLGEVLTFRVDRYLLAVFATPAAVGFYSVASTAPEILRLPSLALSTPIFHRVASGTADVRDFRKIRRLCLLGTVAMAGITALVAPLLIKLTFGPEYAASVTPLRILLLGELGIALYHLDGSALGGLGHMSSVSIASLSGFVLVAVADVLLIRAYGVAGAAWASAITYTAMGLLVTSFLRRRTAICSRMTTEPQAP